MSKLIFIHVVILWAPIAASPILTPNGPLYIMNGGSLALTCEVDQDAAVVNWIRNGFTNLQITNTTTCSFRKSNSLDTYSYSMTCDQLRRFTMVKYRVNSSDDNTTWSCQIYSLNYTDLGTSLVVKVLMHGTPYVTIVGGDAYLNWTINNLADDVFRFIRNPTDNASLMVFFSSEAMPYIVDNRTTFTGDILRGIVSFTLSNVKLSDAGRYTFTRSNGNNGTLILGGQVLIVAVSPDTPVIKALSLAAVVEKEYKLNCSTESRSAPLDHNLTMYSYWKQNGVNISLESGYIVNRTILTISNLNRKDYGVKVTCRSFEDQRMLSAESSAFFLNVLYGPDNTQISPSGQLTVDEGRLLNMTCSGECNPPCSSYQWYKDSQLTLLGSSQALAITNVSRNSAGVYSCTVNNTYIAKVATAQITVRVNYGPDRITLSPSQVAYIRVENSSLSVNCSADCVPGCQYRWTGPGVDYPDNTGVLSISKISRNQAGVITCTAYNPIITSNSATATVSVTVQYGPDSPVLTPDNTVYTVNESSVPPDIRCSADCFPSCSSRWYKDQNVVYGNPAYLLSLGNVYRNATGTYSCRSENMETNATAEKAIQLVVQYSPTIDMESRNGSHNDTSLMIKCSAHGIPEQYTYRLTHKSLSSGIEIRQVSYEFISAGVIIHRFINPTYMDTGIYTCSVNNGILDYTDGSLDKSEYSTVWIKGLPSITSRETSFYAEVGHSGRLIIELYNSLLDLVVTWYKHNGGALEKLLNSDKYNIIIASSMVDVNFYSVRIHEPGFIATLEIRNITEEDFSLYQVHVQNSVGEMYPLQLQLRVIGSTPQEKIDSGPVSIGSAIGSTLFVSLIVTVIGILLYRKRNAHDKGNRVKGENTPRSLETSTEKSEGPQSTEKEGQYLELQQINGEDGENLNVRSSRTVFYETIHSNPNDQEHVYHDLSSEKELHTKTQMFYENVINSTHNQQEI